MMIAKALEDAILGKFQNLEADIKNCPDSLWEQKYGGDYYWQQVFHVLASTMGMLSSDAVPMPELPIPAGVAFLDPAHARSAGLDLPDGPYTGPHTKEMMLDLAELAKTHIHKCFVHLSSSTLFEMTSFLGNEMPLFNKIEIISSHIFYHVGALDAALRDNGGRASM
jgi:hypothetical protein